MDWLGHGSWAVDVVWFCHSWSCQVSRQCWIVVVSGKLAFSSRDTRVQMMFYRTYHWWSRSIVCPSAIGFLSSRISCLLSKPINEAAVRAPHPALIVRPDDQVMSVVSATVLPCEGMVLIKTRTGDCHRPSKGRWVRGVLRTLCEANRKDRCRMWREVAQFLANWSMVFNLVRPL